MACVASDGSLTPVAAQVLGALASVEAPGTVEAIASAAGLPVYRVRATLRELQLVHLVDEAGGAHMLTPEGRAKLAAIAPAASAPGSNPAAPVPSRG